MKELSIERESKNYSIGNLGSFDEIGEYSYLHPLANIKMPGKVFLGEKLKMSSMEISFQVMKPGKQIPFNHKHKKHEEVYVVIKGEGEFIIDDEVTPIKEGSVIRIATGGSRRWKNTSNEDLVMMCIQGMEGSFDTYDVSDGIEG